MAEQAPLADSSRRIRAAYDEIAAAFAARNAAMPEAFLQIGPRFVALVRGAAAAAGSTRPRVLDVGCGAGRDAAWLAAQGAAVAGVDLSAGMLAQAQTWRAGGRLLHLAQMDMRRLGLRSGGFHGVWSAASLLHLPKREAPGALVEMRRVLATGGALMLALQQGAGEVWERGAYGKAVERLFARYSQAGAAALLAAAGFTVLECDQSETGTRRWLRFLAVAP